MLCYLTLKSIVKIVKYIPSYNKSINIYKEIAQNITYLKSSRNNTEKKTKKS